MSCTTTAVDYSLPKLVNPILIEKNTAGQLLFQGNLIYYGTVFNTSSHPIEVTIEDSVTVYVNGGEGPITHTYDGTVVPSVVTIPTNSSVNFEVTFDDYTNIDNNVDHIVNTVTATSDYGTSQCVTTSVPVESENNPNCSIEKTTGLIQPSSGSTVQRYIITITNTGDETITDIVLNDTLSVNGVAQAVQAITETIPNLTPGQAYTFNADININTALNVGDTISNTITMQSTQTYATAKMVSKVAYLPNALLISKSPTSPVYTDATTIAYDIYLINISRVPITIGATGMSDTLKIGTNSNVNTFGPYTIDANSTQHVIKTFTLVSPIPSGALTLGDIVLNTLTATYNDGATTTCTSSTVVTSKPTPPTANDAITIEKFPSVVTAKASSIGYNFIVTNHTANPITITALTDVVTVNIGGTNYSSTPQSIPLFTLAGHTSKHIVQNILLNGAIVPSNMVVGSKVTNTVTLEYPGGTVYGISETIAEKKCWNTGCGSTTISGVTFDYSTMTPNGDNADRDAIISPVGNGAFALYNTTATRIRGKGAIDLRGAMSTGNVGDYSLATGTDNTSDGTNSLVIGTTNDNSGNNNILGGISNSLSGNNNLMIGDNSPNTITVSASNSMIGGQNHVAINATNSVISGSSQNLSATVSNSVIVGTNNITSGAISSLIMGGFTNTATANNGILTGDHNTSGGTSNIIGGTWNNTTGTNNLIIGDNSTAKTTFTGANNVIAGLNHVALTTNNNSLLVGNLNNIVGTTSSLIGGTGNITTGTSSGLIMGGNINTATANYNILTGDHNTANTTGNILGGSTNTADTGSGNSLVVGANNTATSLRNIISGDSNEVSGVNNIVGGWSSKVSGGQNLVVGDNSPNAFIFSGSNNIIGGQNQNITGNNNVLVGIKNSILSNSEFGASGDNNIIAGRTISTLNCNDSFISGNTVTVNRADRNIISGARNSIIRGGTGKTITGNIFNGEDLVVENMVLDSGINSNIAVGNGHKLIVGTNVNILANAIFGSTCTVNNGTSFCISGGQGNKLINSNSCLATGTNLTLGTTSTALQNALVMGETGTAVNSSNSVSGTILMGRGSFQLMNGNTDGNSRPKIMLGVNAAGGSAYGIASGSWITGGADYAEYFELETVIAEDDRIGYFVEFGDTPGKVRISTKNVIGVFGSFDGTTSVIGDSGELDWTKRLMRDKFGRTMKEKTYRIRMRDRYPDIKLPDKTDGVELLDYMRKLYPDDTFSEDDFDYQAVMNPDYDPSKGYISRSLRPEWAVVSLLGKVIVRDNGKCIPGEYCSNLNGIAAPVTKNVLIGDTVEVKRKWYVLSRVSEDTVRILFN